MKKRIMALMLACVMLCTAGCGSQKEQEVGSNSSQVVDTATDTKQELTEEQREAQEAFASSTPENDTDVGLKNIKIDTADFSLTDEQKAVLAYFDDDYLSVPSFETGYEFLRRYPQVFEGAQLSVWGTVKKVISMDSDKYEMILWLNIGPGEYEYSYEYPEYEGNYLLLSGKTGDTWFMEGDTAVVNKNQTKKCI